MQTFLPYEDFDACAAVLDRARLGKQRLECKQILNALFAPGGTGWSKHPVLTLWRGNAGWLLAYYVAIVQEWKRRGYQHTMQLNVAYVERAAEQRAYPRWFRQSFFYAAHRWLLQCKDPVYYGDKFPRAERVIPVLRPLIYGHPRYFLSNRSIPVEESFTPLHAVQAAAGEEQHQMPLDKHPSQRSAEELVAQVTALAPNCAID